MARRLLDRETNGELNADAAGAAMQRAAGRVFEDLASAVGPDGVAALVARAVATMQNEHPAIASMRRTDGAAAHLDVAAAIEAHGPEAARAGVEAVLAALIDILSALIGADMTRHLLHDNDS
jgi:hypothetical protein